MKIGQIILFWYFYTFFYTFFCSRTFLYFFFQNRWFDTFFCKKYLLAPSALAWIYLCLSISTNNSKPMFLLVRLIHNSRLRVNVSFNGMLKIKLDTFPVNWWFDIDLLYFIYGFAFLLCSFSYVALLFCTQPTKLAEGYYWPPTPIRSAGPSVSPFVSMLTFEVQWFYFDTFVWSRPRVLKLHRTYLKFILCRCAKLRFQFD